MDNIKYDTLKYDRHYKNENAYYNQIVGEDIINMCWLPMWVQIFTPRVTRFVRRYFVTQGVCYSGRVTRVTGRVTRPE